MARRGLFAVAVAFFLMACGDETTINNYALTDTGIIVGKVVPAEVEIWARLDSFRVVPVDPDGDFVFTEVPPGEHVVEVEPQNYSKRRISQIEVWPSQVVHLWKIELSTLPYPIYRTYPADGDSVVSTYKSYGVEIKADESLDTTDLNANTVIVPHLEGHWHGKSDSSRTQRSYEFYPDQPPTPPGARRPPGRIFRVGTTYQVTIDGSVRTTFGVPLGRDIEFTFTTEPLTVDVYVPTGGLENGVRLAAFTPTLYCNDTIDIDSVAKAVTFAPPIEGIWLAEEDDPFEARFIPTAGPLPPTTDFEMIVSDQVPLSGVAHLGGPDTTRFTTEPVGVRYMSPCNGCSGSSVSIEFNVPMDHVSVESAFALTSAEGDTAQGTFQWDTYSRPDRSVWFRPSPPLKFGEIYEVKLSTSARSEDGYPIYREVVSYFLGS